MAATWSTVLPECQVSVGYSGESYRQTVRTPFDAGYTQTWPMFTKRRRVFRGGWNGLTQTQFNAFMTFFEDDALGGSESFTWSDNAQTTSVSYTVRFRNDSVQWELVSPETYKVTFEVEEV